MFLTLLITFYAGFWAGSYCARHPQEIADSVNRGCNWVVSNPHRIPYEYAMALITTTLCVLIATSVESKMWLVGLTMFFMVKPILGLTFLWADGHVPGRYPAWLILTLTAMMTLASGPTPQSEEWLGMQLRVASEAGPQAVWELITSQPYVWHTVIVVAVLSLQTILVRWVRRNKLRAA